MRDWAGLKSHFDQRSLTRPLLLEGTNSRLDEPSAVTGTSPDSEAGTWPGSLPLLRGSVIPNHRYHNPARAWCLLFFTHWPCLDLGPRWPLLARPFPSVSRAILVRSGPIWTWSRCRAIYLVPYNVAAMLLLQLRETVFAHDGRTLD